MAESLDSPEKGMSTKSPKNVQELSRGSENAIFGHFFGNVCLFCRAFVWWPSLQCSPITIIVKTGHQKPPQNRGGFCCVLGALLSQFLCLLLLVSPYFLLFHDILEPQNSPPNEVTGRNSTWYRGERIDIAEQDWQTWINTISLGRKRRKNTEWMSMPTMPKVHPGRLLESLSATKWLQSKFLTD